MNDMASVTREESNTKSVFSPEQQRVIAADGNIIISAGAGSGKTTVMIQNILNRIVDRGVRLSEMLIVTFTKASAADMRVKLSAGLVERKEIARAAGDVKTAELIEAAEGDMPVSDIGTLHSFCYRLIGNHFFAAGVDPSATISDEGEAKLMLSSAVRAAVQAAISSGDPVFATVYDMLTKKRSGNATEDKVTKIVEYALSMPEPEIYLCGAKPDSEYFSALDGIIKKKRDALAFNVGELKSRILAAKFDKLTDAIDDLIPYIDGDIDEIRGTTVRKDSPLAYLNDEYKALKEQCKKHRKFVGEADAAKERDSSVYANALLAVARDALCRYTEKKRARAVLDYSDLEHGALRVLKNAECIRELSTRLKYVYIDEFQDVNPLQAEIAKALESFAAMFLVGDVKQSIYGFRRCNPIHFMHALEDPAFEHVTLNGNYRSSKQVIDCVNSVFDGKMTVAFGGVDYETEKLVCKRYDLTGETSYVKVRTDVVAAPDTSDGAIDKMPDNGQAKAAPTAAPTEEPTLSGSGIVKYSVKNAGSADVYDPEAEYVAEALERYLRENPADKAAVLVRSVKSVFCADLTELLGKRGIPYRIGRSAQLADCQEAVMLLDILRCADNRYDDLALYTALRSPMGGFSDRELYEIAQAGERRARKNGIAPVRRRSYAFWQKVVAYDEARYAERLDKFKALREDIVNKSKTADAADTLGYITSRIDYFRYVYENCKSGGAEIVESLISFAAERQCDVHAFIDYCDRTTVELDASAARSAVTITTMHSSKGLQYDYVIVAETSKKFNLSDVRTAAIVSDSGVAIKFPDSTNGKLVESVPHIVEKARGEDRTGQEEMRLFYVALTRAMKKLTVCGKYKPPKDGAPPAPPSDAFMRYADFMHGIPFETVDPPTYRAPDDDRDVLYEVTPDRIAAIADKSRPIEISRRAIKTCVTAIAESSDGDYTSTAPVLTKDEEPTEQHSRQSKNRNDERDDEKLTRDNIRHRGTAYHRAMELIDFDAPDIDAVAKACENFELVTPDEILVAAAKMRALVRDSAYVFREQYFIVDVPLSLITGNSADTGSELLQGVIDLLIVDKDGNATIVDYKTTSPSGLHSAAYRTQLELYAYAVEHSTPFKVVGKFLYSFVLGDIVDNV